MLRPFAGAFLALAFASPASAAVLVVTYQGFASGRAMEGVFGAGTEFQNVAYQAAFTIDTERGFAIPAPDATVLEGSFADSPVLAAFIEINGHRRDVTPTFGRLRLDPVAFRVSHIIESRVGGLMLFQLSTDFDAPPASFDEVPAGVIGGSGSFVSYTEDGREAVSLTLTATELVVAPPVAQPLAAVFRSRKPGR